METTLSRLEGTVKKRTGKSVKEIREITIDEARAEMEKGGNKLKFYSAWPLIGRGNVHRGFKTREEINQDVDKVLSDL